MSNICLSHNAHTPKDMITIYLKAFVVFGAIFVPGQLRKTTQLSLSQTTAIIFKTLRKCWACH